MKKWIALLLTLTALFTLAAAEEAKTETLYGYVLSVEGDNALLISTEAHGQVLVRLPEAISAENFYDTWVKVDFNGVMTMSLPGQINADAVTACFAEYGEIEEIGEESILLAINGGEDALEALIAETSALPEGLKIGDTVRVFYDGKMTKSIPPQITIDAMERAAKTTVIAIEGNPTTGYEWTAAVENLNVASLVSVEYVVDDYEGEAMPAGIGGTYFFTFRAVAAGETVVNFSYARSWEDAAVETQQFKITVTESGDIACEPIVD